MDTFLNNSETLDAEYDDSQQKYVFNLPRDTHDALYSFKLIISSSNLICDDIYQHLFNSRLTVSGGGLSYTIHDNIINSAIFSYIMGKKCTTNCGQYKIPIRCGFAADGSIPVCALKLHEIIISVHTPRLPYNIRLSLNTKSMMRIHIIK